MGQLIGVDFGTGGCKTTVMNETGEVIASAFQEYITHYPHMGWSEQNPDDWINALIATLSSCFTQGVKKEELLGLAVTASTHNAVLADKNGDVIRPCIMWTDQRSMLQTEWLKANFGQEIFDIAMQQPSATWTMPQLLWVKENEPENYEKISRIYFVKDYVRSFLTGDWGTDIVDAQGTLLFDARKCIWSKQLCDIIGLPVNVLPPVHKSKEIVGHVTGKAAGLTGLPCNLPVVAGCSDTAAEDFGAGAIKPGQLIFKLATAANVNLITAQPLPNRVSFTYPHVKEGLWYTSLATNSCASSYRWLRDSLFGPENEQCAKAGRNVYELMDEMAAKISIGSEGMIYHPFLNGERCPYYNPQLRASFVGMSMIHEKGHFARAVLEGVAFSLNDCFQIVKTMGVEVKEARLIGGGAKSKLWSRILCDITGIPVIRPVNDDSSFGGAMLAGVGVGVFASEYEAVDVCVRDSINLKPNEENHEKYQPYFSIYKHIVEQLSPVFNELYKLRNS